MLQIKSGFKMIKNKAFQPISSFKNWLKKQKIFFFLTKGNARISPNHPPIKKYVFLPGKEIKILINANYNAP